jgi:cytochrome c biogenesis protein ResB
MNLLFLNEKLLYNLLNYFDDIFTISIISISLVIILMASLLGKKALELGHKVKTTVAAGTTIYNNILKSKDNSGSGSGVDNKDKDKK